MASYEHLQSTFRGGVISPRLRGAVDAPFYAAALAECSEWEITPQGTLRRRKGTKGFFWGCSRWQEGCSTTFPDNRGKPAFGGKEAHDCPTCSKGVLRPRQGANGKFWGCSCYPECRATYPDNKRGRPDLAARKGGSR